MDNKYPQSLVGFDPTIQGILEYLEHHLPGYPFLTATDTLFVEELQRDFPHLDILEEIKMEQSDYFDQKSAVRVGKMLGAHTLLMGSFTKLDKKTIRIDARLIKTETGELLKADKVVGNPKKLGEMEGELAIKIASNLNVAVGKHAKKAIQADKGQPIKAIRAYTRGLNLEDEQQLSKAYEAYKEALAAYPKMDEAKDRIQALEPLISAGG